MVIVARQLKGDSRTCRQGCASLDEGVCDKTFFVKGLVNYVRGVVVVVSLFYFRAVFQSVSDMKKTYNWDQHKVRVWIAQSVGRWFLNPALTSKIA